ncbi:hypothetical protein DFR70_10255 [Nocardia tenerifensis]|uniref:Uncharacterized protein n=1 Tax=Nocardia tenerifensis TaxID=228006 RepID=A0A318K5Q0_9NOCA|nr:type IV toxin-antitoxin system AbiEi family antitoxin domain-containing protein [Nocardia tenerifensis]PXX68375.1 hypothetical protein DFR70_10255 [Nocardia tenerifensis]
MDAPQLISRQQALASGMSDHELQRLCRTGRWRRVRAGHYLNVPEAELTPAGRHLMLALATCEAMSDSAIASHCSALVIHGLPTWSLPLDRAHMTRNRANGGYIRKQLVLHAARLDPDEITIVNGLRVTTVPRTLIDIARSASFEAAVAIGDSALRQGLTTADELREHVSSRRRRGSLKALRVIAFLDGRSESVGESRSRVAIRRAGLPVPELQARVFTEDDVCVGRVDFLFAGMGVIGEFDESAECRGELPKNLSSPLFSDRDSDGPLRDLGWQVIRWNWADLADPAQLVRRLRAASGEDLTGYWAATPRI